MVIFILAILISLPIIWHFLRPSQRTTGKSPPEPSGAWPLIGHLPLLAGTKPPHLTLGNLADKYGPIFTIKLGVHQTLVISNSEMAKECLSTNDKAFSSRPKSLTNEILGYNYAMVGFTAYGPYWRQIRKVVALQLLSSYRLEKLRHVRETEVTEALRDLYNKWVKYKDPVSHKLPVDLKGFFYNITMNTIMKIIVGKRYIEYEGNGEDDQRGGSRSWSEALGEFLELSGKISVSDSLPYLRFLDLDGTERAMKRVTEEIFFKDGWMSTKGKPDWLPMVRRSLGKWRTWTLWISLYLILTATSYSSLIIVLIPSTRLPVCLWYWQLRTQQQSH